MTAYLKDGGALEGAAQIAYPASTRTTQLYNRRAEEVTLDEVERVVLKLEDGGPLPLAPIEMDTFFRKSSAPDLLRLNSRADRLRDRPWGSVMLAWELG